MKGVTLFGVAAVLVVVYGTDENRFTEDDYKIDFPNGEDAGTLKLVNIMFRHGNRTPDGLSELYPNDPHLNYTYFPYGLGQLTNAGKLKLYSLGTTLRNRYNSFLGKYYYPEIVEAISTDYNRTKMSLLLVLAGLFPPKQEDLMAVGLPWQPIPYNYLPKNKDKVLVSQQCQKYKDLHEEYNSHPKVQLRYKSYEDVFAYLTQNTGKKIESFADVYHLYFGLSTQEEYGLPLPEWTKSVWPEPITSLAAEEYFISMGSTEMKRILVGYFFEKLIKDAHDKINDSRKLGRKMHLYSAHESNLAQILLALGIYETHHVPLYGSNIIWELHQIDGVFGFKIYYDPNNGRGAKLMKMPQCKEFCPLDVFESLVKDLMPIENLCN